MKKKLLDAFGTGFFAFFCVSVLLTWLQGGGRYRYNVDINWKLYLFVAVPIGLMICLITFYQEYKKN